MVCHKKNCFVAKRAGILLLPEFHRDMKYKPTKIWGIWDMMPCR